MLKTSIVNTHDPYWKKCADEDPCATFYHTPSYTRLICDTFPGWENATLAFEDEKGVQAIFPMLKKKYWKDIPFYMYESVTQGVYGGPVFTSIGKSKTAEIEKIIVNKNNIRIISNPFSDWRINSKKFRSSPTFTQILNLQTDFTHIWNSFSKSRREEIRYSKRQGIEIKQLPFIYYYDEFYKIYQDQIKRWGSKTKNILPLRYFSNIGNMSRLDSNIEFWSSWKDGVLISGIIVFKNNSHVTLGLEASLTKFLHYRPEDLLLSTLCENYCNGSYTDLDFGKSAEIEGLIKYKAQFGTKKFPLFHFRKYDLFGNGAKVIEYFINHLPFGITHGR